MDHQGGGTRPRHALGNSSGPQQAFPGTGPQPAFGPGSGAQRALGRDPARGYPPARAPQPDGYPEGNAYSPVSGYRRDDWDESELGPADGPPPGREEARKPRRRLVAILAALAVVVVGGGGFAGYEHFGKSGQAINPGNSLRLPTSDPTAQSTYFSAKLGRWQHITTRKLDPAPLTVAELYPPGFTLYGTNNGYQRVATSLDSNCTLAVFGPDLQASVQSGSCKQVVRATYLSSDKTMMGTIGVVNLGTATAAQKAGQVSGAADLIAPLSATKGPAKKMLNGTGVEYAEVKGHYLILMYAEFTNLKAPATDADRQRLVTFAEGMFSGSANIALSQRLLTGKPQA
ncbi:MAG TPA: hypothetical protein VFB06_27475 [Streptosporangiaceae bacterium]|nr:hypothetical protein [Streptosporangiaceae bacterium]